MRKLGLIIGALLIVAAGWRSGAGAAVASRGLQPGRRCARRGRSGRRAASFGGFAPRQPMTVELASVARADVVSTITVVGNLIGAATVEAVPKVAGRLQSVFVRLGDRVSRGQPVAKIEDREILEQVKQAEGVFQRRRSHGTATSGRPEIRRHESRAVAQPVRPQLLSRQSMDDADARSQAATAQLDLARASLSRPGHASRNCGSISPTRSCPHRSLVSSPGGVSTRARGSRRTPRSSPSSTSVSSGSSPTWSSRISAASNREPCRC